jgi:hypothetical protein
VIDLPRSPPTVTHTSGGSVIISCVGDILQVLWASPQPNYRVGIQFDAGLLTITFTSDSHVSTISAGSDPGGDITIDTDEHAIR